MCVCVWVMERLVDDVELCLSQWRENFSLSRSASGSLPPLHSPSLTLEIDQLLEGVMEKIKLKEAFLPSGNHYAFSTCCVSKDNPKRSHAAGAITAHPVPRFSFPPFLVFALLATQKGLNLVLKVTHFKAYVCTCHKLSRGPNAP